METRINDRPAKSATSTLGVPTPHTLTILSCLLSLQNPFLLVPAQSSHQTAVAPLTSPIGDPHLLARS